ncbi:peptidase E [Aquimarina litoralis]|nr:peptidase E [Aquimarina litoralis]
MVSVLVISLCSFNVLHKFYVSVTQIEFNEEEQSLQIISRIFIDDIEKVLRERYDEKLELQSKQQETKVDQYLNTYLKQKLRITVDGEEVFFSFLGKEYDNDLVLCYLEVENVSSFETIKVSNLALMDFFEEQQNIIHVKKGKKRKSLILEKERDQGMLKFSE